MQRPVLKRKNAAGHGWTPERRALQSARMRADKIWLKSTGPRTANGKARSAANSLKSGGHTRHEVMKRRLINLALRKQVQYIKAVAAAKKYARLNPAYDVDSDNALAEEGDRVLGLLIGSYVLMGTGESCFSPARSTP